MDNNFLNIDNAETAYTLGLLWSDGYICKHSNGKYYSVGIRICETDMKNVKHILCSSNFKNWKFYAYKNSNENYKKLLESQIHNINLCNFLLKIGFDKKSYISHECVLQHIPENLHRFYFRGLIDGDGCFYIRKNNIGQSFSIASSYNQDWSYFQKYIFEKLKINTKIVQSKNKKGSGSCLIINNKIDIVNFGNFVYENMDTDKIGFLRKYNKFLSIKKSYENAPKCSRYNNFYKGIYLKNIKTNEIVEIVKMKDFCIKYKLNPSGVKKVLSSEYIQWKGWILPTTDIDQIKKIKYENFSSKISKTYEFIYKGEKLIINNLNRYCREHNLSYSSFKLLIRGVCKQYKNYIFIKKI